MTHTKFAVSRFENRNGFSSWRVEGRIHGVRFRRNFKSKEEAAAEKASLERKGWQADSNLRSVATTLTEEQVREAEALFSRVAGQPESLAFYLDYALAHYRAPEKQKPLAEATAEYIALKQREHERTLLSIRQLIAIRFELGKLAQYFPKGPVSQFTPELLTPYLERGKPSLKTYNNRRGLLSTFFKYAFLQKGWTASNPVEKTPYFRINHRRGSAVTITAQTAAELMAYVETFEHGELVPYFALCLFAGIRPCIRYGEITKLGPQLSSVQKRDFIRLVAVPRPLNQISGVILDSLRWDWVMTHTGDLNSDRYAREEVSRFRTDAQNRLERAVQDFVGLNRSSSRFQLAWFSQGEAVRLDSGRELLSYISELCDEAFPKAPQIQNELVNRRLLSSAAAAARMRLIELMFSSAGQPGLGIPESQNPPEKSIYLSVLRGTGLHHEKSPGHWTLGEPDGADPCKVRSALREIQTLLEKNADKRLSVESLSQELRRPPFGLRDGIIPIFLAVIAISQRREIAVYENGTFLREVGKDAFLRMSKSPEKFDIQYCRIEGVRAELFEKLVGILALSDRKGKEMELLDLVQELCQIVAGLPEYSRNTKRLPKRALAVRDAILQAQEPVKLVFHELPVACGFPRFGPTAPVTPREAHSFANALKDALDEIRQAYPILESRILKALAQQFDYGRKNLEGLRRELAGRAEKVSAAVADIKLKGFSMRLEDTFLSQEQWIDSVGSFLGLRPPTKWKDDDEDVFARELAVIAGRFKRSEAMAFATDKDKTGSSAIRVALTQADGTERQQVLFVSKEDEKDLHRLKGQIAKLVNEHPQVGVAAASQAIWDQLKVVLD